MKSIISRDNSTFKQLKKLAGSSRERRKSRQTLLDGVHLVSAYLDACGMPEMVIVSQAGREHPEIPALLQRIPEERQIELPPGLFEELAPVETPSGILAVIDIPQIRPPAEPDFCLLLEDVQDPGNLGSILRSAAAAGVQVAYLSTGCCDAWSPKVLRGGMGAHFVLAIEERADLQKVAANFHGITVGASLRTQQSLYDLDLRGPVAFVVGNEGAGITAELLDALSQTVIIPMHLQMESLNVAAAAAVCLFERVRQTH